MTDGIPINRWEWENSDTGLVVINGYDDDDKLRVRRTFTLSHTELFDRHHREWHDTDDDGGWEPDKTFKF